MKPHSTKLTLIVDEFRAAWRSPEDPGIEDFVARASDLDVPAESLLRRLLDVEIEHRRPEAGFSAEEWDRLRQEYAARFSDHPQVVASLLLGDTDIGPPDTDVHLRDLKRGLPHAEDVLGDYVLLDVLGRGGMGVVWKAEHRPTGKLVALKTIHQDRYPAAASYWLLKDEAASIANLHHPHIAQLRELSLPMLDRSMSADEIRTALDQDGMFLVFEYVAGGRTLSDVINGDRPPNSRVAELAHAIAAAVAYAHAQGVYHHDLKPANVLLDHDGTPKITDFGLAHRLGETDAYELGGTPVYMSPERLAGEGQHYGKADVWAVGILLYELLTGQRPFASTQQVTDERFRLRPIDQLNPKADPKLVGIVARCLDRNPDGRITAGELTRDLKELAQPSPETASGNDHATTSKTVWLAAAVAVPLLALAIWGFSKLASDVDSAARRVDTVAQGAADEIRALYEDPDVLADKLKSHIRDRAEQQITAAKAKEADWRVIDEIHQRRESALERVDDLVATIREGLTGDPDPIFVEAARVLAEQGVDEALEFLDSKEPTITEKVERLKRRRDQAEEELRDALRSWLLKAELYDNNLEWARAQSLLETIVRAAPEWSSARRSLGESFMTVGRYTDAEPHLLAARASAGDDLERASAANSLARWHMSHKRFAEAEPLCEEFLQLSRKLHGDNHPETAIALNNLAWVYSQTQRTNEAESLYREALAIGEEAADRSEDVATTTNNYAILLLGDGRHAAAEVLLRRAVGLWLRTSKPNHPTVAAGLNNLGGLLQTTGRNGDAAALFRGSIAMLEESLGPAAPGVGPPCNQLAGLLRSTGHAAEAEVMSHRALVIHRAAFEDDGHTLSLRLHELAVLLEQTGRLREAEALYRRGLAVAEESMQADAPEAAVYLIKLGKLLGSRKQFAEAEPLLRRAFAINQTSFKPGHPKRALALNELALLLLDTQRYALAEPLLRQAIAIDEDDLGPEGFRVAMIVNNLAQVLWAGKKRTEAEVLFRRAFEIVVLIGKSSGRKHPYEQTMERNYASVLGVLELDEPEIKSRVAAAHAVSSPLKPILPEVDRLLGPPRSVTETLLELDQQDMVENLKDLHTLSLGEAISPHLDTVLGVPPSIDEVLRSIQEQHRVAGKAEAYYLSSSEPITPHLDDLIGKAVPVADVLNGLDEQYRAEGKPSVWFLPLDEPVSPHLDELLGAP